MKKYKNGKINSISLLCEYPDQAEISNLHSITIKELQKIVNLNQIEVEDKDSEIQNLLDIIFTKVKGATEEVANQTLEKLGEMNPDLASELVPNFEVPKWSSIFKCGLMSDLNIPINKRGSGVRRLILLNFFRAKVERSRNSLGNSNVIYAFEELETDLHPN